MKKESENIDFEHIYVLYFSRMKRFAKEYVLSDGDAENIVQDVFLDLWEKRDVLGMPVNLLAFLFTAVKNKCIDYMRHRIVIRETANKLQEENRIALKMKFESLEAFDQGILKETDIETILARAIDSLPEKCRDIFIKSRIEGKKQKEIAVELNVSLNTIETQMGIAYKKLREELKDYLPVLLLLIYC